ncbi:hypothetical protein M9Y10_043580 [Tritrichomonas musculus]|uniref:Clan SC, family S28, unassigned serine peptidase n=1 Tax=Tritrichomonas musculus TaxID=1915356 RepID=A0ABR2K088_9EUKA
MIFNLLLQLALSSFYKQRFQQRLNHLNTHTDEFFDQIYLTDFDPNISINPKSILILLGGFSRISEEMANSKPLLDLKQATNSHIIILEHRFFGESIPADGLTPQNRNYLMIYQALADIDYFLEYVQYKFCSKSSCNIGLIGSGYAGSLAAWSRVRYPHLTTGAWSSSAPLLITPEFPFFDKFHAKELDKIKSGCLNSTKNVYDQIENIIDNGDNETINNLKNIFDFKPEQDNVSLLYAISEVLSLPLREPNHLSMLNQHCNLITQNETIDSISETYHSILNEFNKSADLFDPFLYSNHSDLYNLLWFQCNQVGWFHTSSGKLRSKKINISYFNRVCQKSFGIDVINSTIANIDFGGTDPYLSNAVFTNGEKDPYKYLSVRKGFEHMGRLAYVLPAVGPSADLYYKDEHDQLEPEKVHKTSNSLNSEIKSIQDTCVQKMAKWILRDCENKCKMGTCVLSNCICSEMWDGEFCDRRTHTSVAYTIISAVCIVAPTLLLLFFGTFVLFCGTKEDTEIDNSRKSYFT